MFRSVFLAILTLLLPRTGMTSTIIHDVTDFGNLVDAGNQEERTAIWRLPAAGYARTFVLSWQMYSIPDRLSLKYYSPTGWVTFETGLVSGAGSKTFTVASQGNQQVNIVVNLGGGQSGTAWDYRIVQDEPNIIDLTLSQYTGADATRRLLYGNNMATTYGLTFDATKNQQWYPTRSSTILEKIFRFTVPSGAKALRVTAPEKVHLTVAKGIIPAPEQAIVGHASQTSANPKNRNTVLIDSMDSDFQAGTYYVTASMANPGATVSSGSLTVDCFMAGQWHMAEYGAERILAGIEESHGLQPPATGNQLTLISHGRVNSPIDMKSLGDAATSRWGRYSYYVNWSEGAYWNTGAVPDISLEGSRFSAVAGKSAWDLLVHTGYQSAHRIDFLGHSWGTYVAYHFSIATRPQTLARFFALDPANPGVWPIHAYNVPDSFAQTATYVMAIYGNGPYGSSDLTKTANDSIALIPNNYSWNWGPRHLEPVTFATNLLNHNEPTYVNTPFSFALVSGVVDPRQRPWLLNRYWNPSDGDPIFVSRKYETLINTNGTGTATHIKYFSSLSPNYGKEIKLP